jgi:hypothetical protein
MKRLACVLAWLIAFVPAVAAGQFLPGPVAYAVNPETFRAGEFSSAVFSFRTGPNLFTVGDSFTITIPGATVVRVDSQVFIDANPTFDFVVSQINNNTLQLAAAGAGGVFTSGAVIWFKVQLQAPPSRA